MKYRYFGVFLLLVATQVISGQPLTIINQDYELAKNESIMQNKLLLIDFYTTWCAPCKKLDKLVFQDTAVSNEIAKQFVLLKYDAEKDSAHQLTAKFHIALFPSTVVLNQNQFTVNKMYGTGAGGDLVSNYQQFLKQAITNSVSGSFLKGISNKVKLGFPQFYLDNINRKKNNNLKTDIKNYWASVTNFLDEVPFVLLSYYAGGSEEAEAYFFANKAKFEQLYGEEDVKFIVAMISNRKFDEAITTGDRKLFKSAADLAKENYDKVTAKNIVTIWEERLYLKENKWAEATKLFILRKSEKNFSDDDVNSFCWRAYEKCTDKTVLKKCSKWMEAICLKKPEYQYLDTYARLLYKSGSKKAGVTTMQKAIKSGIANKEDVKDSEEWLHKNKN